MRAPPSGPLTKKRQRARFSFSLPGGDTGGEGHVQAGKRVLARDGTDWYLDLGLSRLLNRE